MKQKTIEQNKESLIDKIALVCTIMAIGFGFSELNLAYSPRGRK